MGNDLELEEIDKLPLMGYNINS